MLSLHIICFCTLDCYIGKGLTYQGHVSKTKNDRECQFWTDFEPHSHENNNANAFPVETMADAENYCRNPDGNPRLWCYTTDPNVRHEYCAIPLCESNLRAYCMPDLCKISLM